MCQAVAGWLAVTMLLASHALAAGPLAASQPGFTILDPLAASLLGVVLFGEHIRTDAAALAGGALALAVVIGLTRHRERLCERAASGRPLVADLDQVRFSASGAHRVSRRSPSSSLRPWP